MKSQVLLWVCVGATALTSCSDDKVNSNKKDPRVFSSDPLTAEELCVAKVISGANEGQLCVQNDVLTPSDPSVDPALLSRVCRPGAADRLWAEKLLAAATAGRVSIAWAKARECLEISRELRRDNPGIDLVKNGDWAANRDGPCKEAYKGLVASGSACQDDWDCADAAAGCYTATPAVAGSKRCQIGGTNGQDCHPEYFLCSPGFFCDGTALQCMPVKGEGEDCAAAEECGSGVCSDTTATCITKSAKAAGETCTEDADCAGECAGCVKGKCAVFGGQGDACDDWFDCALDLGCTGGICTTVGAGQQCAGPSEGVCAVGTSCLPDVDCSAFESDSACSGNEYCVWDENNGACAAQMGHCFTLPKTGPCVLDEVCAEGSYCDPANTQCVEAADLNEVCEPEGNGAPMCKTGLSCIAGTCQWGCEFNADCPSGKYCMSGDSVSSCESIVTVGCESSAECGDGKYCLTPEDVCAAYEDATSCNGDTKCTYERTGVCEPKVDCTLLDDTECAAEATCAVQEESACQPAGMCGNHDDNEAACNAAQGCKYFAGYGCLDKCLQFDGDATGCAGAGCEYDSSLDYCNSPCIAITSSTTCAATTGCGYGVVSRECGQVYDCSTHDNNESACTTDTKCAYSDTSSCEPTDVAQGECKPKAAVGEPAPDCMSGGSAGTSDVCMSGACIADDPENPVCSETSNYGCIGDDKLREIVGLTFLFGMALMRRRRRQR